MKLDFYQRLIYQTKIAVKPEGQSWLANHAPTTLTSYCSSYQTHITCPFK